MDKSQKPLLSPEFQGQLPVNKLTGEQLEAIVTRQSVRYSAFKNMYTTGQLEGYVSVDKFSQQPTEVTRVAETAARVATTETFDVPATPAEQPMVSNDAIAAPHITNTNMSPDGHLDEEETRRRLAEVYEIAGNPLFQQGKTLGQDDVTQAA